ncbi:hypothetical protein TorRG33x02_005100, partial [Trema orientale]
QKVDYPQSGKDCSGLQTRFIIYSYHIKYQKHTIISKMLKNEKDPWEKMECITIFIIHKQEEEPNPPNTGNNILHHKDYASKKSQIFFHKPKKKKFREKKWSRYDPEKIIINKNK